MRKPALRISPDGTNLGRTMYIPGLQMLPQVEVIADCTSEADQVHAVALRHHVPQYFDDHRQMIHKAELDAVVIAGPPAIHHSVAIAAAELGLHILCEKPMARNAAKALIPTPRTSRSSWSLPAVRPARSMSPPRRSSILAKRSLRSVPAASSRS